MPEVCGARYAARSTVASLMTRLSVEFEKCSQNAASVLVGLWHIVRCLFLYRCHGTRARPIGFCMEHCIALRVFSDELVSLSGGHLSASL